VQAGLKPWISVRRQAAKLLHVEVQQPGLASSAAKPIPRAHPSVAALLSWQHAQLLAALPKRWCSPAMHAHCLPAVLPILLAARLRSVHDL